MPRGRGSNRGFRPGPPRGRGRGRGKGFRSPFLSGTPGLLEEIDQGTLVFEGDFQDFTLDHVIPPSFRPRASPARARGGYQTPPRGFKGRGGSGYRGGKSIRGIGFSVNSTTASGGYRGSRISISTLEKDRPLLRPVLFVRGENQKTLFEEVEEILHVPGEEGGTLEDHAPSADLVERLFHQGDPTEELSTDVGKDSTSVTDSEDQVEAELPAAVTVNTEETTSMFVIDTTPSTVNVNSRPLESAVDYSMVGSAPLGETIEEETIVYVAPHPRTGRTHAAPPSPIASKPLPDSSNLSLPQAGTGPSRSPVTTPLDSITLNLTPSMDHHPNRVAQAQARTRSGLKSTPRSRKIEKKERAAARRRQERQAMFSSSSFGLSVEKQHTLRDAESESAPTSDPRLAQRRRNDSDIDWGTDDEDAIEDVRNGIGGMDLDPELSDLAVLARFAHGVPGLGTGEEITIADLDDAAKMREEDEEQAADGDGSRQEDDGVFDAEERREIGEEASSDSSDSADESPRRGFEARLNRLRKRERGRAVVDADVSSDEQDDSDSPEFSWANRDEQFLKAIEDVLDENADVLHGSDRKSRNKLFKAIQNGDFEDDYDGLDSLNTRKKDRTIPSPLRDQWERDRAKKAERKRIRALARLQAVAEASTRKYPGKKQKIFSAARVDGDTLVSERVDDMALLEQQIRNFLGNLELKSMVLPPKGKEWRKRAHLLAEAFNLKSKSKGKGDGRFTTLIKTTRSGVGVNERKITRLVGGNRGEGFGPAPRSRGTVRNRDGDEVGKMAPKLSETNIGFKLLQQMGWEEGERIGVTGGLVDPLTAIIKTTKRGLGATR